jgi:hypothetical protein
MSPKLSPALSADAPIMPPWPTTRISPTGFAS